MRFMFSASSDALATSSAAIAVSSITVFSAFTASIAPTMVDVRTKFGHPRSYATPAVTDGSTTAPDELWMLPFTTVALMSIMTSSLSVSLRLWRRPAPIANSLSLNSDPSVPYERKKPVWT